MKKKKKHKYQITKNRHNLDIKKILSFPFLQMNKRCYTLYSLGPTELLLQDQFCRLTSTHFISSPCFCLLLSHALCISYFGWLWLMGSWFMNLFPLKVWVVIGNGFQESLNQRQKPKLHFFVFFSFFKLIIWFRFEFFD